MRTSTAVVLARISVWQKYMNQYGTKNSRFRKSFSFSIFYFILLIFFIYFTTNHSFPSLFPPVSPPPDSNLVPCPSTPLPSPFTKEQDRKVSLFKIQHMAHSTVQGLILSILCEPSSIAHFSSQMITT